MHIIGGILLIFVFIAATMQGYQDRHHAVYPIVNFVGGTIVVLAVIAGAIMLFSVLSMAAAKAAKEAQWRNMQKEADEQRKRLEEEYRKTQTDLQIAAYAESNRLYLLAKRTYPDPLEFTDMVRQHLEYEIERAKLPQPTAQLWEKILRATRFIYEHDLPKTAHLLPPPSPIEQSQSTNTTLAFHPFDPQEHATIQMEYRPFADYAEAFDVEKLGSTFVKAFMAYLRAYPKIPEQYQFTIPITDTINVGMLVSEMTAPFGQVNNQGMKNSVFEHSQQGAQAAWKEFGSKNSPLIYANNYEGDPALIPTLYLHPMLQPLFWEEIPWGLTDQARTQHHRALGAPGSGKTTFLSHFILHDFPKVAEGKVSLVVMDSQRLARQISWLQLFAKDHPFHERLIFADPDPAYSLALNPFQIKRNGKRDLDMGVDILTYALGGMTEDGTTDLQEGALRWIIRGAAYHPNASLDILKEFFKSPPARQRRSYPFHDLYDQLDTDTRFYFDTAFPELRPATLTGLLQRLMNLPPVITRMLNANSCNLDLFDQLQQGGKILLVDTDQSQLSEQAREVFGRLFIAMLKQVVDRRGGYEEGQLKHVFVVIDEAHDYIRTDGNFGSMLVKARNKRVCLTVAHHNDGQILNPQTKRSLQDDVFIRSHCTSEETADGLPIPQPARIETGPPERARVRTVAFKKLDWTKDFPLMTKAQYHEMRQRVFSDFGDTEPKTERQAIPLEDASD